jgi:predicted DNA-binding transcriptional regulator AlpA
MTDSPAPDLITIPEAARRLGRHRDSLYMLARTGQFPPAVRADIAVFGGRSAGIR